MGDFNPCETDACKQQCDTFGARCEEICIAEINRLRAELLERDTMLANQATTLYEWHRDNEQLRAELKANQWLNIDSVELTRGKVYDIWSLGERFADAVYSPDSRCGNGFSTHLDFFPVADVSHVRELPSPPDGA